jgi:hypothetical protein
MSGGVSGVDRKIPHELRRATTVAAIAMVFITCLFQEEMKERRA